MLSKAALLALMRRSVRRVGPATKLCTLILLESLHNFLLGVHHKWPVLRYGLLVVVGGAALWLLADLVASRRRALAPA